MLISRGLSVCRILIGAAVARETSQASWLLHDARRYVTAHPQQPHAQRERSVAPLFTTSKTSPVSAFLHGDVQLSVSEVAPPTTPVPWMDFFGNSRWAKIHSSKPEQDLIRQKLSPGRNPNETCWAEAHLRPALDSVLVCGLGLQNHG